jgi:hypothetical protein
LLATFNAFYDILHYLLIDIEAAIQLGYNEQEWKRILQQKFGAFSKLAFLLL